MNKLLKTEFLSTSISINHSWSLILLSIFIFSFLIGCGSPKTVVPEGAKPDQLTMHREKFKIRKGLFKSIEYDAEQGTLVVLENRDVPTSRLIALPVVRIRSKNKNPAEPIFWLAGGPGGSNMKFKKFEGLIENHDLIMVGYRGADGSSVLKSPAIAKAMKGVGDDLSNKESSAGLGTATLKFLDRLKT